MELSRAEREATKPINWGRLFYERQLLNGKSQSVKPTRTRVRSALEQNTTDIRPLDGSKLIQQMNDEELCEIFAQYPKCSIFYLKSWYYISEKVLRCISMTFSETLVELDLSESQVQSAHLDLLLVRCSQLKILRMNRCQHVDVNGISSVVKLLHLTLKELYLKSCCLIKQEPLLWIGGAAGPQKQSLKLLRCLDLSLCPIVDAGFVSIPPACTRLQFLNLQDCRALSDDSVQQVGRYCRHLQLLNISGCQLITDKAVSTIGSGCGGLVSLNISRCVKISDKGIRAIATGCVSLQAVNLAGLARITEEALWFLATRCEGLLMLNLTGCERVTVVGLDHLIRGLNFVEKAVSFMGFKPVDEHVTKKLEGHLQMLERVAEKQLSGAQQEYQAKSEAEAEEEDRRINSAAALLQSYMHRYKLRMHFYNLWQRRLRSEKAVLVQRIYRGHLGRCRASRRREELKLYLALAPFAIRVQKNVRGYLCRIIHTKSSQLIREMYFNRRKEAESGIAVRLQAHARRFLATLRVRSWRELVCRRAMNMDHAAATMQRLARMFVSKIRVKRRRQQLKEELEARDDASIKIKVFLLTRMRRFKSKLTGDAFRIFYRRKWAAITEVQRLYRGFKARERVYKIKIDLSARYFAASIIQKIFRASRVLHWRDMRLNVIAAYVLDRQYLERRGAVEASRLRYKQFVEDNRRDSASEPDDEFPEEEKWEKLFDKAKKMHYWINYATNSITYDEPSQPFAHEHGFLGKRIKVFWIVQGVWYEGQVTRYHRRKRRHRVDYDDGDHEWMDLAAEGDRVQLQMDDGTWAMYVMYVSESQLNEQRKQQERLQRNQFKQQAFRDAQQWKIFIDDRRGDIMFISTISGELRSGLPNAADWMVQDDGFGFPCFYNLQTEAVVYEDPRFVYDVDEDIAAQRQYVLQEVRYAMYFCKDLWEDFEKATSQGQERQIRQAMLAVVNSPKIDHLNSFVIRAKALYKQVSVVDKPMDEAIHAELAYAGWLTQRLAETRDQAGVFLQQRLEKGRQIMSEIKAKTVQNTQLLCRFCSRPTQKHLEFCATCGKRQVFF